MVLGSVDHCNNSLSLVPAERIFLKSLLASSHISSPSSSTLNCFRKPIQGAQHPSGFHLTSSTGNTHPDYPLPILEKCTRIGRDL